MMEVSLQLLCVTRSGTLSRLIREIGQVGLQYRRHQISINGEYTHITIEAVGELNCSRDSLEEIFETFAEVLQVQELDFTRDGKQITEFKTRVSDSHVSTAEQLSPAVLLAAEKRLSDILGPVASVIVEAVKGRCANAGELYARLAEELNDDGERKDFLSVIEKR